MGKISRKILYQGPLKEGPQQISPLIFVSIVVALIMTQTVADSKTMNADFVLQKGILKQFAVKRGQRMSNGLPKN